MRKRTPDSCNQNPNTTLTKQDIAPVTIRSDHLVDVREAKRMLKTVSAQKLCYHCAKGHLPSIRESGKLYFSEAVLQYWHHRIESQKRSKFNH